MNWAKLRHAPWLDTRARFVSRVPRDGALLDLGSSDGETLRHIAELRPDLRLFAVDLAPNPAGYPANCIAHQADVERDRLPWTDASMAGITCMHLVEHLNELTLLIQEAKRLLQPGGEIYFETPHPKTVDLPSLRGNGATGFTFNFYDDSTHIRPVPIGALAEQVESHGLRVVASGTSRNWLFAASHLLYQFAPASRQKYTARVHWLGWSAYLIARRTS